MRSVALGNSVQTFAVLVCGFLMGHPAGAQVTRLTVGPLQHSGVYHTLQEAVDHAPQSGGAIIFLEPGIYREKVNIEKPDITLVGKGRKPEDTVITWGDSAKNTGSTFKSGSIIVSANGFKAENLSIVNTWWQDHPTPEDYSQAVALQ